MAIWFLGPLGALRVADMRCFELILKHLSERPKPLLTVARPAANRHGPWVAARASGDGPTSTVVAQGESLAQGSGYTNWLTL